VTQVNDRGEAIARARDEYFYRVMKPQSLAMLEFDPRSLRDPAMKHTRPGMRARPAPRRRLCPDRGLLCVSGH
jgi:hypothetical protein